MSWTVWCWLSTEPESTWNFQVSSHLSDRKMSWFGSWSSEVSTLSWNESKWFMRVFDYFQSESQFVWPQVILGTVQHIHAVVVCSMGLSQKCAAPISSGSSWFSDLSIDMGHSFWWNPFQTVFDDFLESGVFMESPQPVIVSIHMCCPNKNMQHQTPVVYHHFHVVNSHELGGSCFWPNPHHVVNPRNGKSQITKMAKVL